jgi:hypothetical protein
MFTHTQRLGFKTQNYGIPAHNEVLGYEELIEVNASKASGCPTLLNNW